MSDVRLVTATIDLVYEEVVNEGEKYELEFNEISQTDEDSIGQWVKHAKVRTETNDSDTLMLNLLVELYRKIDKIELLLTKGAPKRLELAKEAFIESIGLEHFKLNSGGFEPGKRYYGRVEIATFPKREISFFFEAMDASLAKIVKMHVRDEKEWEYYMRACERAMIRQMKGLE
jgi:hypothetical protein